MATAAVALFNSIRRRGYSYAQSYVAADAAIWGRSGSFSTSSGLNMGRWPNPTAFTSTNPDYGNISYITDATLRSTTWSRATFWNQCFLARPYTTTGSSKSFSLGHAAGYQGNTRVNSFGHAIYLKRLSTGKWERLTFANGINGESVDTSFNALPNMRVSSLGADISGGIEARRESETGGISVRAYFDPSIQSITGTSTPVVCWHGYLPGAYIDPYDVADIAAMEMLQLVLNDPDGPDDRQHSRYLWGTGIDYIPDAGPRVFPNSGWSRHRIVSAKAPDFEISGYFTMSVDEFDAAGGYPSEWDSIAEGGITTPPPIDPPPPGDGETGGDSDGETPAPSQWTFPPPTVGRFAPILDTGEYTFFTRGEANTPPTKARRRRRARIQR
jgi:hypothetical protein